MERRTGNQRILRQRNGHQRLAADVKGQGVPGRFLAPSGIAHQIDASAVFAVHWQNAREPVAGGAADEHRDPATRRVDVEIAGGVAGFHLDAQGLPGASAQLIVDVVITLDRSLDDRRGRALGEVNTLGTAIRVGDSCDTNDRLDEEQRTGNYKALSVQYKISIPTLIVQHDY